MAPSASAILELLRPKQWTKNLLLFAALLFSGSFLDLQKDLSTGLALLVFVLLSCSVYAFNDVHDLESDRRHPQKKNRPLASGRMSPSLALGLSLGLLLLGLGLSLILGLPFFFAALGYLASSTAYTLWLKHEVILDVFFLAAGFVIRAVAGGLAIDVRISPWLLVCTTLLALFLALSKRRAEVEMLQGGAKSHRKVLAEYAPALLDQMIGIVASATVVAYSLYAFSMHAAASGPWMMLTVPFVLYGIFRYLYLSHQKGMAGSPELILLKDRPMQLNLLFWVLSAAAILYCGKL